MNPGYGLSHSETLVTRMAQHGVTVYLHPLATPLWASRDYCAFTVLATMSLRSNSLLDVVNPRIQHLVIMSSTISD